MKEKKIYYRRLDILRNISCIMILLYHLNLLRGGFLAVCTFFTLSGYLGCLSSLKSEKFSIKTYYINRLKILYLPLIVVVFATIIVFKIIPNITWLNLKNETTSVVLGYNNFWQLNANLDYFTKNVNSPHIHLWYISILMQFNLIFPIVFAFLKNLKEKGKDHISTIIVILLTIITTSIFIYMSLTKDIMSVYYNTFARIFSILFGTLLALVHYKYNFKISSFLKKYNSKIFIIYIIIFIGLSIFVSSDSKYFALFMILATIISTRIIEYSTYVSKHSSNSYKLTKFLANISYEIYLVQYPIIFFMQSVPINSFLKLLLTLILTFIISIILHIILNLKIKNKILKIIKIAFISMLTISGMFILIGEKDHSSEMKELEDKLNENLEIIEQKNDEFLNSEGPKSDESDESNKSAENAESTDNKAISVSAEIQEENSTIEDDKKIEKDETQETNKEENDVSKLRVVGIGDSVLLGAINELYKKFPNGYFDGKVSRSLSAGETILKDLKSKGKLTDIVILSLANNGDYSTKKNKELMEILGDRQLYWVNAVGADDPTFNDKFREFAKDYSNIHIVEWDVVSKNHPEYFYADGIHTKGEGIKKYASTIYEAISKQY